MMTSARPPLLGSYIDMVPEAGGAALDDDERADVEREGPRSAAGAGLPR